MQACIVRLAIAAPGNAGWRARRSTTPSACILRCRTCHERFAAGELNRISTRVASPYRDRSHFDGQKRARERPGKAHRQRPTDGSIEPLAAPAGCRTSRGFAPVAISQNVPLILRGEAAGDVEIPAGHAGCR